MSIILLDVRFFKTSPEDILGEEQWQWLDRVLGEAVRTSKVRKGRIEGGVKKKQKKKKTKKRTKKKQKKTITL